MPNIAVVLKDEIRRLARREIKASTSAIKEAIVQFRREIAQLKRLLRRLQVEIAYLKRHDSQPRQRPPVEEEGEELLGVRYSARSVKRQRKRLRLSAADFGKLLGVSTLTVYNWENGKARPTKARILALVAARDLGRREAREKLALLKAGAKKTAAPPATKPK